MNVCSIILPRINNFLSLSQFLHLCGVVHRDVKPENLMFDGSNRLKLCDFGLAAEKIGQYVKTRSNLAGTPRYMAPEAFKNEPCSEKIDIFAFGMILWEMYTGRLPWAGRSFSEVRSCVSSGTERPAIPSSAPPELARLISGTNACPSLTCHLTVRHLELICFLDCWAHDPQQRPDAASILLKLAVRS
jgi:serine/threonine protein kinase